MLMYGRNHHNIVIIIQLKILKKPKTRLEFGKLEGARKKEIKYLECVCRRWINIQIRINIFKDLIYASHSHVPIFSFNPHSKPVKVLWSIFFTDEKAKTKSI